ncbi:amidohydrolase family protein [Streptomyces canus]|uniref:amidohydrolase family protein n=1 Tax=Streptomyces canus TaxID=58343 RepID=UPI0033A2A02F
MNSPNTHRIDVHHHASPDFYNDWLVDRGITAGGLALPDWSVESARKIMERHGVATSILSISTPGVHLGDDKEARAMARRVNEYVAEIVRDDPQAFGLFATLTLPDVDGALAEAEYAFDTLDADGVILLANARGTYLGDPQFEPLMEELNRRKAVVFVHPSSLPVAPVPGIPPYIADFLLDTTRAAVNLVRTGTTRRHPDIRFILAHAGGFLPYAAHRIAFTFGLDGSAWTPPEVLDELGKFYFDTAQSSTDISFPTLLSFTRPDRVLFGSDYPHVSEAGVCYFTSRLDDMELADEARFAIDRGSALNLFPRFKAV